MPPENIKASEMTLRDLFACLAMQALIGHLTPTDAGASEELPALAYKFADAMLEARGNSA